MLSTLISDEDRHGIGNGNEDGEDDFKKWMMTKKTMAMRAMGLKDEVDIDYDGVEKPAENQTSLHSFTG